VPEYHNPHSALSYLDPVLSLSLLDWPQRLDANELTDELLKLHASALERCALEVDRRASWETFMETMESYSGEECSLTNIYSEFDRRVFILGAVFKLLQERGIEPYVKLNLISCVHCENVDFSELDPELKYLVETANIYGRTLSYDRWERTFKGLADDQRVELSSIATRLGRDMNLFNEWMVEHKGTDAYLCLYAFRAFLSEFFGDDFGESCS
jgi:hypothetical protein